MRTGMIVVFAGMLLAGFSAAAQSQGSVDYEIRKLRLSQQESEKMMMEQFKKINDFLVRVQENYATYAKHITILSKKLAELEKENALLKSEIAALKKAVADEADARKKAMERLVGVVAGHAATTSTSPRTSAQPVSGNSSQQGPAGEGEFHEYIVQKGATLSAISKAYGVSVKDIKTANRLKNNMIRVGQKLYIPVKK